jgi:hypothetical protein
MKYMYVYVDGSTISSDEKIDKHEKRLCAWRSEHFYYALTHGATLFDPLKLEERNYKQRDWKITKVNAEVFDYYTKYLGIEGGNVKTNKNLYIPLLLTN